MNKIIIHCGGGLGNRLGGLVAGLQVAELCNLTPVVNWPKHNTCDCIFENLFEKSFDVRTEILSDLLIDAKKYTIVSHLKPLFEYNNVIGHNKQTLNLIKKSDKPIIFYNDEIPKYLDFQLTINQLKKFKPIKPIRETVKKFVKDNNISTKVVGLHIRKTDLNLVNENVYVDQVSKNPNTRYFICSDSKQAEQKFKYFNNTIIKNKTDYVEKLIDDRWKTSFIDADGNAAKYNVQRSNDSVVQALEDMLILSHTNIEKTSRHSSFLKFALHYQNFINEII